VDPNIVTYPGMTGDEVMRSLQNGDATGSVWRPGETDVSIRPGWFYHPAEDARVKTVDELVELYFTSVGRNSKLLLNVPPTPDGVLHETDVSRLVAMRQRLDAMFATDIAARSRQAWRLTGDRSAAASVNLGRGAVVGIARLAEDISRGQAVARYTLEGMSGGSWRTLASGTTIGYCKLDRFAPTQLELVRVLISDSVSTPEPLRIAVYGGETAR
jgi:alpha-L-fucosidase